MNSLLDDDDEELAERSRELTLSTGAILGIFLAIVLLCGAFFGFGYKMASHTSSPPIQAAAPDVVGPPTSTFNNFKPAAGSPIGSSTAIAPPPPATKPKPAAPAVDQPAPASISRVAPPPVAPAVAVASFVVQVAAFTHPEDADLLVSALKAKGYPAFARTEPQDKLHHIQVGPFTNRKDAETAKQRLLVDGYQPILK
jgi:DedD protein